MSTAVSSAPSDVTTVYVSVFTTVAIVDSVVPATVSYMTTISLVDISFTPLVASLTLPPADPVLYVT